MTKQNADDIIFNLIKYTEEDDVVWEFSFIQGRVNTYIAKYRISKTKVLTFSMKSTHLKSTVSDHNYLDVFMEQKEGVYTSKRLLFTLYFGDYKNLFFLAKIIRYKMGDIKDPYAKKRKELLTYVSNAKEQLGYVIVSKNARRGIFTELSYVKKSIQEAFSLTELIRLENKIYYMLNTNM